MSSGVVAKLADALLGLAQAAIVVERATASSTAFLTKIKVLIICATPTVTFEKGSFQRPQFEFFGTPLKAPFGMETLLERLQSVHSKRAFQRPQFLV